MKYAQIIPLPGTEESLKIFVGKKKKKDLPAISQHLQIPDMACKNALPNFPAGVSVPLDCHCTTRGPLLSGVKD